MEKNILKRKSNIILIAGVAYMMSIGVLYSWGVIRRVIESDWGWTATQSGLPYSLILICFATGNLIGGRMQLKLSARMVGTIGAAMIGAGLILSGVIGNSVVLIVLLYGVLAGLGIGLGYSSFLPTVLKWYAPGRKGFVSGWIIGGFGLTSLYLAPLTSFLIDRFGLQPAFIILGVITLLISLPLAQFIKNPPDGYVPPESKSSKNAAPAQSAPARLSSPDKTWTQMLRTTEFYLLFLMFLCSVSIGQMVIGNVPGIATLQAGVTDAALLAGLVSFMAVVNCGGRIIAGIISDKIGWANTLLAVFIIQCVNMIGFRFYTTVPMLIAGIALAGLCFGSTLSVFPAITVERFGLKNYGSNYGIMYMAFGGAGIAAPLIAGHFFDLHGNYELVYIICAAGMAAMVLINIITRRLVASTENAA